MGRPKLVKPRVNLSVTLPDEFKKYARKVGDGNISRGLDIIIKRDIEIQKLIREKEREREQTLAALF